MNGFVIQTKSGYKPTHLKKGDRVIMKARYDFQTLEINFMRGKTFICDADDRGYKYRQPEPAQIFFRVIDKGSVGLIIPLMCAIIRLMTCGLEMEYIAKESSENKEGLRFSYRLVKS